MQPLSHVPQVFDEILAYVDFTAADQARLSALHPLIAPHLPAIARRFYDRALEFPGAAAVVKDRAILDHLRATLVDWMASGLLGPWDASFHDKRSRIGRRHVEIGLPQHYMFTAIDVVRCQYHDLIRELLTGDVAWQTARSVHKLFDIELAVMLRHYQHDSEERRLADERKGQTARLLALQTLAAGLAHEVRNPLNSARLQLELLERRARRDGVTGLATPVALAQEEIVRLAALLDDFLAFTRPPELRATEQDAVPIVERVVNLERALAKSRGAHVTFSAASAPIEANVDPGKLHQIVLNLVRNAIEAVPSGGHVNVSLAAEHDHMRLRVEDDGPGIPDGVRARIFEPFFSTKERGTGLGMAIVHSLVSLHAGTIDVDTSPRGTRVDVVLPLHR